MPEGMNPVEWQLRLDLALAHRVAAELQMDELMYNHISARLPFDSTRYLITPGNVLWGQMDPRDLVISFVDPSSAAAQGSDNVTADFIHSSLLKGNPQANSVFHCHGPDIVAASCLREFPFMTQDSALFFERVAYFDFTGVAVDESHSEFFEKSMGAGGAHTLIMRNHGVACAGDSVAQSLARAFFFKRACEVAVRLLPMLALPQPPVSRISDKLLRETRDNWEQTFDVGPMEWPALKAWDKWTMVLGDQAHTGVKYE